MSPVNRERAQRLANAEALARMRRRQLARPDKRSGPELWLAWVRSILTRRR